MEFNDVEPRLPVVQGAYFRRTLARTKPYLDRCDNPYSDIAMEGVLIFLF